MTVSILHISDLHRDPTQGIRNGPLVRSLLNDRERYVSETPVIASPSLIVVSGDIVYGVPASHTAPYDALVAQYQEAEEFLIELTDSFLGGDRNRVVLIPGNHDVNLPATLASLSSVAPPVSKDVVADLFSTNSVHRWSWQEFQLFRVQNNEQYDRRIELFANLYSRFYCGDRTYSLVPEEQYDIFSFPAEAIVIAAFNSCFNNDPLHRAGCIHPDAIAQAARRVEALRYQGYIPIAVWHHNTAGGPHSDDYMDSDTLQVLIDCGFSIGLHGHQHKPTFIDERFRFGTGRKITVISAGTLCGGYHALPHGHDRSYNLIELDTKTLNAKLHLRQMRNESFASPVWGEGRYSESNTGTIHFAIQEPPTPKVSVNSILSQAESLIARKEYVSARDILLAIATSDGMARRLLAECYTELPYDSLLIDNLFPPQSLNEAVLLADALWELGDRIRLGQLLRDQIIANSPDPTAIQLRQKYQGRVN